jgi:phospholipid-translocating ATPase
MVNALAKFFPEQEKTVIKDHLIAGSPEAEQPIPLHDQRINTGVSSINSVENAERPGGFVLVVDGSALLEVCRKVFIYVLSSMLIPSL